MRREIEAAGRAVAGDLEIGAEQFSLAAARTAAAKAALQRRPHVALLDETRLARPGFRHRLHDLPRLSPFPGLPDFFPGLLFVSLGLRPGRVPARRLPCGKRPLRGTVCPSDSSSNRS